MSLGLFSSGSGRGFSFNVKLVVNAYGCEPACTSGVPFLFSATTLKLFTPKGSLAIAEPENKHSTHNTNRKDDSSRFTMSYFPLFEWPLVLPVFFRTHLPRLRTYPCLHLFGFALTFTTGLTWGTGATLPAPENVALAGAPNTPGCTDGGGLHASPLLHAGGTTLTGKPPFALAS